MTYVKVGIWILMATLIFQLVTLPVEYDASRRAKKELERLGIETASEKESVSGMLHAAAFTYVESMLNTVLNLLRLIMMTRNRDD